MSSNPQKTLLQGPGYHHFTQRLTIWLKDKNILNFLMPEFTSKVDLNPQHKLNWRVIGAGDVQLQSLANPIVPSIGNNSVLYIRHIAVGMGLRPCPWQGNFPQQTPTKEIEQFACRSQHTSCLRLLLDPACQWSWDGHPCPSCQCTPATIQPVPGKTYGINLYSTFLKQSKRLAFKTSSPWGICVNCRFPWCVSCKVFERHRRGSSPTLVAAR